MAPEILRGEHYDEKVDVYSFGILMWEVVTMQRPNEDNKGAIDLSLKIISGLRPSMANVSSANCQPSVSNLFRRCWDNDPKKRPSFREIYDQN